MTDERELIPTGHGTAPSIHLALGAPFRVEDLVFPVAPFRLRAALLACFAKAIWETLLFGSRFKARTVALLRFGDTFVDPDFAFSKPRLAFARVAADARPLGGGGSLTPARRAFESPIAIAC
jgi:hypothetical protein